MQQASHLVLTEFLSHLPVQVLSQLLQNIFNCAEGRITLGKINEACAFDKNLGEINKQVFIQVFSKVSVAEEGTTYFAE